jgi:hypothetical protein
VRQWVVARRPSRRPACASRNAPLHTEAVRRARASTRRIQSIVAASRTAAAVPSPPGTNSVSIGPRSSRSEPRATSSIPEDIRTGPALAAASSTQ